MTPSFFRFVARRETQKTLRHVNASLFPPAIRNARGNFNGTAERQSDCEVIPDFDDKYIIIYIVPIV